MIHDGAETPRKRTPMELLRSVIEEQDTAECDALHELHGDKDINDCKGRRCSDCVRDSLRKAADLVEAELDALKARALPEGMEWLIEAWPKFEDDAPVKLGDMALIDGDADMVEAVQIWIHGKPVIYGDNGSQQLEKSERVKRPAVRAADGEPLKVGQTVWNVNNGMEFTVSRLPKPGEYQSVEVRYRNGSSTSFDPCQLTHQRPVLDADGNRIEPPMDVWWVCEGDEFGIHAERLHVDGIDGDGMVECRPFNGGTSVVLEPSELYVKKPALDADGVPIKKGDTVFRASDGREFEVTCIGGAFAIRVKDKSMEIGVWTTPVGFTHAKPEPPDSWEKWREEFIKPPCVYCRDILGVDFDNDTELGKAFDAQVQDMERRARALAVVSE